MIKDNIHADYTPLLSEANSCHQNNKEENIYATIECGPDFNSQGKWDKLTLRRKMQDSLLFSSILMIFGLITWGMFYILDQIIAVMEVTK